MSCLSCLCVRYTEKVAVIAPTGATEKSSSPFPVIVFFFLFLYFISFFLLMEVWMRVPITLLSYNTNNNRYVVGGNVCRRGIRASRNGPLGPNGLLVPGPATAEPLTRPAAAWTRSEAAESTSGASATKSATCR